MPNQPTLHCPDHNDPHCDARKSQCIFHLCFWSFSFVTTTFIYEPCGFRPYVVPTSKLVITSLHWKLSWIKFPTCRVAEDYIVQYIGYHHGQAYTISKQQISRVTTIDGFAFYKMSNRVDSIKKKIPVKLTDTNETTSKSKHIRTSFACSTHVI